MSTVRATNVHPAVTADRVLQAVQADEMTGFCLACGAEQDSCEPDTRARRCQACGALRVFGAEEILIGAMVPGLL